MKLTQVAVQNFQWPKKAVFMFRRWRQLEPSTTPVEAEDMFEGDFVPAFLRRHGDAFLAEKVAFKDGTFHHGLTQPGKVEFLKYVESELAPKHVARWVQVVSDVRSNIGL